MYLFLEFLACDVEIVYICLLPFYFNTYGFQKSDVISQLGDDLYVDLKSSTPLLYCWSARAVVQ
jgi:hypothetical protein